MKTKHYWKVVLKTERKDIFTSFIINEGKYCLTYRLGKITKSKIPETGILVFETKRQAKDFTSYDTGASIILKVLPNGKQILNPVFYNFWQLEKNTKRPCPHDHFPPGTVAFESVKVVSK